MKRILRLFNFLISIAACSVLTAAKLPGDGTNLHLSLSDDVIGDSYIPQIDKRIEKHGFVLFAGARGVGKTTIAKQYATQKYRKGKFDYVLYINMSQEVLPQIIEFLEKLNIPGISADSPRALSAFMKVLKHVSSKNKRLLVIFDSLTSRKEIKEFEEFCQTKSCCYILTSRKTLGFLHPVLVTNFSRKESLELLAGEDLRPFHGLEKVAAYLGDYPLLVRQASEYLRTNPGITPERYLQMVRGSLEEKFNNNETRVVQEVITDSLDAVSAHFPENKDIPRQIITFLALINTFGTPQTVIEELGMFAGISLKEVRQCIELFEKYKLISVSRDPAPRITIHEVIQDACLHLLTEHRVKLCNIAGKFFANIIKTNLAQPLQLFRSRPDLAGNLQALLSKENGSLSKKSAHIILTGLLDYYLYTTRDHAQALQLIAKYPLYKDQSTDADIRARFTSSALDVLALQRIHTSLFREVQATSRELLNLALNPRESVRINNSLAQAELLMGKYDSAKPYLDASLKLLPHIKEPEGKIHTLYYIAWLNLEISRPLEAMRALSEAESYLALCPSSAIKFYVTNFMALAMIELRDIPKAITYAKHSIKGCSSYFGSIPNDTIAEAYMYLAEALLESKNYKDSLHIADKAIRTYNRFYKGKYQHLDQAYSLLLKGRALSYTDKSEDAHLCFYEASKVLNEVDNRFQSSEASTLRANLRRLYARQENSHFLLGLDQRSRLRDGLDLPPSLLVH